MTGICVSVMEMLLLPKLIHIASEILTHIECSPIPWVSHLLCVQRGGNTATPSLHICPTLSERPEEHTLDCAKPPPLITNGFKLWRFTSHCYVRQEPNMCFPRSSLSGLQYSLQCCTNTQLNVTEACIRWTSFQISELNFLQQRNGKHGNPKHGNREIPLKIN